MEKEQIVPAIDFIEQIADAKQLVLYNDDVNSFDYVILSLIEVCNLDHLAAEQCTLIAHLKGKCGVKEGTFAELLPFQEELSRRDLTAEIE